MSPTIPKSIALIDFSHMLSVNYHARAKDSAANDCGQATINQLNAIRSASQHVIVCMDSPPYWRTGVFPEYKAARQRDPEYPIIFRWCVERLALDGYNMARAPGEESDDVIATLCREYSDEGCPDIRIVSEDKDLLQLVGDNVRVFVARERGEFEIRDAAWVGKHFGNVEWEKEKQLKTGPTPAEVPLVLAIMGDTTDKIPGVKGIGIKGAVALVKTYATPEGMAGGLVAEANACKMKGKELPAFWRNFAAGMAELPRWVKLTTLNDRAALELHPLKYLERLPVQKLVDDGEMSDADDSGFGPEDFPGDEYAANGPTAAELEEERRVMAATLPVGEQWVAPDPPPAPEQIKPRIGKDPSADKVMADALLERQRLAAANTNAPKTPERVAETAERIATGNAAETQRTAALLASSGRGGPADKERAFKPNATLSDGGKALHEGKGPIEDRYDRYGQLRPDPTVMDPPRPKVADGSPVESNGAAAIPPPAPAPAEVVPKTQGPQPERLAMVAVAPPSWELATQPRSPSEMSIVAGKFWNSRFYSAHGNADGTFAVIALGRELGLGAAASVEGFHIVNQRPFAKAVMLKALAERDPNCEWIMVTSADAKHATIKTKHRKLPEVLEYTYTIERAAAAGYLTGKNSENWKTKTQEMLEARATSKGVRRWYPGATFGMHAVEEANDD